MKKQKGITLTVLVITIIVMLILVVVVINFALGDEGILTNAKTASAETEKKAILEELISMVVLNNEDGTINVTATAAKASDKYRDKFASQEIEGGGYLVTITGKTGTTYTYTITGNGIKIVEENPSGGEDPSDIGGENFRKYILGETGGGRPLADIISNIEDLYDPQDAMFINEESTIPNAQTEVKCITDLDEGTVLYLKYKNKAYRVELDEETMETKPEGYRFLYEQTGREGEDLGEVTGDSEYTGWTIIYDNGNSVEAVSPTAMGTLKLGYDDSGIPVGAVTVDLNEDGNLNLENSIYSYNHIIERINNYCNTLTLPANDGVRSVGARNEINEMYNLPSDWPNDLRTKYNGKAGDNEYEQDFVRMAYCGVNNAYANYWMASRYVYADSSYVGFGVWKVNNYGNLRYSDYLWSVHSYGNAYFQNQSMAVRPVITVNIPPV